MQQFTYSFITTMLHSIWQTAGLLLIYTIIIAINPKFSPLQKRNFLYAVIFIQLLSAIGTFSILYQSASNDLFQTMGFVLSRSFIAPWLQTYSSIFFWSYLLVVIYRISFGLHRWNNFKKQYQKLLIKPAIHLRFFTHTTALHFGIHHKITLWCSNAISTPMTFGFWKPVILLPVALVNQLSLEQTEALIIHELTHIKNNDFLFNWLLIFTESLFFFNPFIHIISAKIKIEREKNCDIQVLQFNYSPILYAETLLKIARFQQKQLSLQMAAVKNKKQLLQRIHFFSDNRNLNFKRNLPFLSTIGLIAALLVNVWIASFVIKNGTNQKMLTTNSIAYNPYTAVSELNNNETVAKTAKDDRSLIITNRVYSKEKKWNAIKKLPINNPKAPAAEKFLLQNDESSFYPLQVIHPEGWVEGKEIIITEEKSQGKKITASFRAILINGVWTLEPVWMMTETPSLNDSTLTIKKDSVLSFLPAVQ
jgi:beta-lactamase regulating signal transducer with metallopeptidase domain